MTLRRAWSPGRGRRQPALRTATWTAAGVVVAWSGVMAARGLRALALMRAARPFTQHPQRPTERVVIAGDSSAVGAGSSHPRLSVAGRLGMALARAEVVNVARSGATLTQVPRQLKGLTAVPTVSLVVVLCGGEDIVRGGSPRAIRGAIDVIAARVRELGARLILVPPGAVGRAPIWLPPLSSFITWRAARIQRAIVDAAGHHADMDVIDLAPTGRTQRFLRGRARHYAPDRLHPSDVGYGAWFERIVQQSAWLQARVAAPFRPRVPTPARTVRWSAQILRAAAG